jgi:NAD(P) transhydrogenase subunit alpha
MIQPGEPAPEFTLPDQDGKEVSISDFRGQTVVLVFYPADFSPVCTDQLSVYQEVLPQLEEAGAELASRQEWVVLAAFVGYQVITRVPPLLHTPLMSATNAISAISVVGALVTAGGGYNRTSTVLGFLAVVAAMINVVGGFMITDRMLKMFRKKPAASETAEKETKPRG